MDGLILINFMGVETISARQSAIHYSIPLPNGGLVIVSLNKVRACVEILFYWTEIDVALLSKSRLFALLCR